MVKDEKVIKINKIRKKLKFRKAIPVLFLSLLAIIVIGIIFFVTYDKYEDLTELKIENYKLYQYFGGIKYEYTGEISLKKNREIVNLKYKDIDIEVDSTPIYFSDRDNEMIIPLSMGYYIPRLKANNFKLPNFTIIARDTSINSTYIKNDKEKIELETSFLYDGKNLYIFMYETTIIVNGKEIILSPLSYVDVTYAGDVIYYDKNSDKYNIITDVRKDVIAKSGLYKINLSTDMIMYQNEYKLLLKNVNDAPTFSK